MNTNTIEQLIAEIDAMMFHYRGVTDNEEDAQRFVNWHRLSSYGILVHLDDARNEVAELKKTASTPKGPPMDERLVEVVARELARLCEVDPDERLIVDNDGSTAVYRPAWMNLQGGAADDGGAAMTCNVANLSAITNANGRTEWHYRTHDHWRDVVERDYFEPARGKLRNGDTVFVNCLGDEPKNMVCVINFDGNGMVVASRQRLEMFAVGARS